MSCVCVVLWALVCALLCVTCCVLTMIITMIIILWSSVNLCDLIDKLELVFSVPSRGNERVMAPHGFWSKHLDSQKRRVGCCTNFIHMKILYFSCENIIRNLYLFDTSFMMPVIIQLNIICSKKSFFLLLFKVLLEFSICSNTWFFMTC